MTTGHPDTFAALLGIGIHRLDGGRVRATLTVGPHHLNPHGTAHGALIYTVGAVALAAAANDATHTGLVGSVHVDYLRPARLGDQLVGQAEPAERLDREDLFVVRVTRGVDGDLVARMGGRASRRARPGRP